MFVGGVTKRATIYYFQKWKEMEGKFILPCNCVEEHLLKISVAYFNIKPHCGVDVELHNVHNAS
jgi:hypothetical protein